MGGLFDGILSAVSHPVRTGQQLDNGVVHGLSVANHWVAPHGYGVFGPRSLLNAGEQTGVQAAQMFDPRSRAGLANLASLFAGGGDSFAGKFDATPQMEALGMKGQFAPYTHETGTALDRGVVNEGPIRPGKGYNPSMQKMVERAHTNPFVRASRAVASREQQNALEKQTALEMQRQQAAHAQVARQQIDHQLNAAPMAGKVGHTPEHNGGYLHGPSVLGHPNFLKAMLQRRYQAGQSFNHPN